MISKLARILWIAPFVLLACSSSAQQPAKTQGPNDVVATVGKVSVTLADVDAKAMNQPANQFGNTRLVLAIYEARRNAVDDIVGEKLIEIEAAARGTTTPELIDKEISTKIQDVTEADVVAWYNANQSRVQGASLEQVKTPIRNLLIQQRSAIAYQSFVEQLKLKTPVRVTLEPPRQKIATADSPAQGPASAPIELVEFSDFQCPFCYRSFPTVKQVMSTYDGKIRFVYRNYPLPNHPNARPAAEAAQCANEQGKFWLYHDRLFADQSKLGNDDLKASAAALGLDPAKFNACFDSHKYRAKVDADTQAGNDAGVNGTPAFFINGRLLSGAQPFDEFKKIIDEELARR